MSLFIFILILVVLILVHEFGHFIVAKLAKIKVEEFGIFFPPRKKKNFPLWREAYTGIFPPAIILNAIFLSLLGAKCISLSLKTFQIC